MKFNKKAFKILKAEEKAAITLKNLEGKSSWQAGEILQKSHYKYLEISARAQKFFELFNQHYNLYDALIPQNLKLDPYFTKYLHLVIEKRLKVGEASKQIDNKLYFEEKTRNPLLIETVTKLKNSKSLHEQNLYNAIIEFDRYNNFRILPRDIQEPSAFKRRNKTRFKKHLNISTGLQAYTLFRIKEIFTQNSKNLQNEGFVALTNYPDTKEIIRIKASTEVLTRFSKISIYVFKTKEKAQEYIDLVFEYLNEDRKDPKKGQLFWPNFRNLIKESINYHELNNIAPLRKHLKDALVDMDNY